MPSFVGCEKCGRSHIRDLVSLLILILLVSEESRASPFDPSFMEGVQSVVVNPFNRTILSQFNLTEEQIERIQNRSNPNLRADSVQASNQQYLQQVATQRLNDIIKRVHNAITNEPNSSTSSEKAGFPICNAETTVPEEWQLGNNVTLKFANSVFVNRDDRLTSAVLRLYKINPGQGQGQGQGQSQSHNRGPIPEPTERAAQPGQSPTHCLDQPQAGPQIRVTVSIVHQQKKKRKLERKKRTCNTTMLSSTMSGWVEIDVKCALAYWEQQMRQEQMQQQLVTSVVGMLMIEAHDDEENPLRPGLFFEPPTCDQAEIAVPWSAYRTESLKPDLESWTVPRNPRIDLTFTSRYATSNNTIKSVYISPSDSSGAGLEATTLRSSAIDNLLEEPGDSGSPERDQTHLHRRHHQQPGSGSDSEPGSASESGQAEAGTAAEEFVSSASNSAQLMEPLSNHHRHRSVHNRQHHHHFHHSHHSHLHQLQHHHYQRHHRKHHRQE
ncbi:hypothetical protein KR018_010589 [Drosophila ironensis]|nr:hypothetical protein KR018_010589 [Drosophila ironensis]